MAGQVVDDLRPIQASGTLYFRYPEQETFRRRKNLAEALFGLKSELLENETLFILKHRSDSLTSLYRFNQTNPSDKVLTLS